MSNTAKLLGLELRGVKDHLPKSLSSRMVDKINTSINARNRKK